MPDHNYFSNLIWQIADLLRGPYRPPQYERVMLPLTVLRRFDCVLAPTKAAVVKRGVSYPAINSSDLGAIPNASPTEEAQRSVERFLITETERIDRLLAAKQRILDLLAEKRKAIIATAATRGLDPAARMAPTGVEWIPEAPAHWRPNRIGRLFRQSKVLWFPDLTVLSVYREYGVIERSSRDDNANVLPDDLTKYQLVEAGDLVANKMKAWQGSLGISDLRGITSPDYVVFRPTHAELPQYLHFMLKAPQLARVYLSNSNGMRTNQWRIEPERFLIVPVLLPPIDEQQAIVEHIARETAKLDAVRAATERTVALLKERRAALIAVAATGQLEVRRTPPAGSLAAPNDLIRRPAALQEE